MERKTGILTGMAIFLIAIYRNIISPWIRPCCRFHPSCSEYAMTAFKRHGFFGGLLFSSWRILRCNPFYRSGVDLVPESIFPSTKGSKKGIR